MREIKFRGRKKYGKWLVGDLVQRNDRIAIRPFDDYSMPFGYKVDPQTVGQFTGFKDAQGQELYEGDLLLVKQIYDVDEPDEEEYRVIWGMDEGAWLIVRERDGDFAEYLTKETGKAFVAVEDKKAVRGIENE